MNAPLPDEQRLWPVYEFRPEPGGAWLRYADGQWIPDDGEFDIAFISAGGFGPPMALSVKPQYRPGILWSYLKGHWTSNGPASHPRRNPWHYMLRDGHTQWGDSWDRDRHPNVVAGEAASRECCNRYRCANGRGPEFHINDPYIAAGLLRRRDTKEVVVFPEVFHCMYCGVVELVKREAA
jgi:hypothetical protein